MNLLRKGLKRSDPKMKGIEDQLKDAMKSEKEIENSFDRTKDKIVNKY